MNIRPYTTGLITIPYALFLFLASATAQSELFTRVTEGELVNDVRSSPGICIVDYDEDGLLDIYLINNLPTGGPTTNSLFHNLGGGSFEQIAGTPLVDDAAEGYAATWADFDNDGDLDVAVANMVGYPSYLYLNNGNGDFEATTDGPYTGGLVGSTSASWVDYDLDNDLDLFISNAYGDGSTGEDPYPNMLFRNDGGILNRITTGVIVSHAGRTYAATWGDYDDDGDPDLVTINTLLYPADLFRNNGDGSFTLLPNPLGTDSSQGGCTWVDYDNDGDLDLYVAGTQAPTSLLYRNDGNGSLSKVLDHGITNETGKGLNGIWADFDNDGDQDVFVIFRYLAGNEYYAYLYDNLGDGTFSRLSDALPDCDLWTISSAMCGDLDRDGDMDLFLARYDPAGLARPEYANDILYLNNGNSNHWITLKPIGTVSNRSAVGVKVRCKATINGQPVRQLRELATSMGMRGQPPLELHFGLGDAAVIDSIKFEWPSGIVQVLENVPVDQYLTVHEPCCEGRVGDANGSGEDEPTIADVSVLIDAKFITGACDGILFCLAEADINQSGGSDPTCDDITIGDISILIDYLFITGQSLGLPVCRSSSSSVEIGLGSSVTVDGVMQPGEWDDAATVRLAIDGVVDVTVSVKHDGASLLVAYKYSFVGAGGLCMPEIFIDSDNDQSAELQIDDWWFHVSGTDCEARGAFGVYTDCSVTQPDWQAVPNFPMVPNPPPLDTFEISIPLSKLGVGVGDPVGLVFRVESVPTMFAYWPSPAVPDSPATWGRGFIKP